MSCRAVLVAALADEALLVAVIDGRHAAQRQQHRVAEHVALAALRRRWRSACACGCTSRNGPAS